MMTVHEFGKENKKVVVLIHPSIVMWDYFEYVIPLLEKKYHLIIPALPGYDPDVRCDFTSVEDISRDIAKWLVEHNLEDVTCLYGCSMGGSIVIRMLADFLLIYSGKLGGAKLLEKAFSTDELSKEDVEYAAKVLKMISAKTIWRTFDSCNNYSLPGSIHSDCGHIEYWVAEKEVKARKNDVAYVRKRMPRTVFRKIKNVGHGGLAPFNPEKFARGIEKNINR